METAPAEGVLGNVTRIILKMIRDEYATLQKGKQEESELQESLQKILMDDQVDFDYTAESPLLEEGIVDHIKEYMTELETWLLETHQRDIYLIILVLNILWFEIQRNRYICSSSRAHPCKWNHYDDGIFQNRVCFFEECRKGSCISSYRCWRCSILSRM